MLLRRRIHPIAPTAAGALVVPNRRRAAVILLHSPLMRVEVFDRGGEGVSSDLTVPQKASGSRSPEAGKFGEMSVKGSGILAQG